MKVQPTSLRLSAEVAELLDQLAKLGGTSKAEVIVRGILAQAEMRGLIPSLTTHLARALPPKPSPKTDPERRRRLRLSQQRTRARRKGQPVPKLRAGRPRTRP